MKKFIPVLFILAVVIIFFWQLFFKGLMPIPSDTIVGLYHPYIDYYKDDYPRGIPFKNFLITDPVRQQYPWKQLSIDLQKQLQIPLWNPYNFSGTPLLSNFQSAPFSPFNLLFFLFPFVLAWSFNIFLAPLLCGVFLFLFLNNLGLKKQASVFGSITFAFCGFSVAWMEWGTILSTSLWLPLILLSIDKIMYKSQTSNPKSQTAWYLIFLFSLTFSFFAGHLQTFFYLFIFCFSYLLLKAFTTRNTKKLLSFLPAIFIFLIVTSVSWIPFFQFLFLSGRNLDQAGLTQPGWFIPWVNMIQFVIPDFFGNPATLNYFGVWNYGEFIGYVGLISIIMSVFAIIFKPKKTYFFIFFLVVSVIFAFPNFISKIPFKLSIPFVSTAQPTRLIFIIDFCLSVLAAYGFNYFLEEKQKRKIISVLSIFSIIFISIWVFVIFNGFNFLTVENLSVVKRNIIFPSLLFLFVALIILVNVFFKEKFKEKTYFINIFSALFILVLIFDLFRFGWKFMPFTDQKYLYPQTKVTNFLVKNLGNYRYMATDSKILPPNFSIMYKMQSLDGYDPLYLQRYAELIAAMGRGKPDITPPFGFNRIITPENYLSPLINLLGVKYVLSLEPIKEPSFKMVYEEGRTKIYENTNVMDRAFFIGRTVKALNNKESIGLLFDDYPLKYRAVVENNSKDDLSKTWAVGQASILNYSENKIQIETQNEGSGFLVLTDSFYPTWHATIDGKETKIYVADYAFRGIIVPKGQHKIIFYNTLF